MRIRFMDNRQAVSGTLSQDTYSKPSCSSAAAWVQSWNSSFNFLSGSYASMRDEVIPNFRSRIQKGEVFFNPMERCEFSIDSGYGSGGAVLRPPSQSCSSPYQYFRDIRTYGTIPEGRIVLPGAGFTVDYQGLLIPPSSIFDSSEISSLRTEVSTACLSDRGSSDSNQWETLAEFNKSLGMASSAMQNLNDFAGRYGGVFNRARAAGSAYLLYRYGFTPLMASLGTAVDALGKATGLLRKTARASGTMSKTYVSQGVAQPYAAYSIDYRIETLESISIRATSLDEAYLSFMNNFGFTTKGLLQLPWELIPYSFVVDWFVNVGNFYGALLPVSHLRNLGGCLVTSRSISRRVYQVGSAHSATSGFSILVPPSPVGYTNKWETKNRHPGLDAPGLVVNSNFKFEKPTRLLDAIALFVQRIK